MQGLALLYSARLPRGREGLDERGPIRTNRTLTEHLFYNGET